MKANMDWDQVRVFLAVARAKQLAAAAQRLGLDVSTVSRRVDRLEADVGVALFDRGKDGTTLTAAGETMVAPAEEMERALARFADARDAIETTAEGVVRLACLPGVASAFVVPVLAELHRAFPRVVVELDVGIAYADLTRREADLALRATRPTSGDLVATRVVRTRAVPVTSPEYARELGRLRRFGDARWIQWGSDLAHLPQARFIAERVRAEPVLRTSHFASQLAAAAAGLGVMLAAEPFTAVERLVPVALSRSLEREHEALPHEELWLVGHRALRAVPRVAAVWELLQARLSNPSRAHELERRA